MDHGCFHEMRIYDTLFFCAYTVLMVWVSCLDNVFQPMPGYSK